MLPLLILAAAAAAAPSPSSPPQDRASVCAQLAQTDPAHAIAEANAWRLVGGGIAARECLGLAYAQDGRWLSAATAFELAAREAQYGHDSRTASLWAQAGNAALAGGDPVRARGNLDSAIATGHLDDALLGEVELDRARADVALNDLAAARTDLDHATEHVAADPMAWLLSATLARRQNDTDRATADIAQAVKLAPEDPDVAVEEGNIQGVAGNLAAARVAWERAVRTGAGLPSGKAAAAALKANENAEVETSPQAAPTAPTPAQQGDAVGH